MMESAAPEDKHSVHALESPLDKKPRWQGSLLLRQAPAVWDALSVRGAVCASALRSSGQKCPSSPPCVPGRTQLRQKRPVRVLGALSAAPAAEEDASVCPQPTARVPWSSRGHPAERGNLYRRRGDRLSASPVLLSSVFSCLPVCLWPGRRAFPCCAPWPARSSGQDGMGWACGRCCSCRCRL